jgi:hypothetical protein
VCSLCNQEKATSKVENEKDQKYRKNDVASRELSQLFKRKKKYPTEFDNLASILTPRETFKPTTKFMAIDASWINMWKSFVGDDGDRPGPITNNALRCRCQNGDGSLICDTMNAISRKEVPVDDPSTIRSMGLPDAELITDEQWGLLTEMYPSDACFEVSLSLNDENNWEWSPHPCCHCIDKTNRDLEAMNVNFDKCPLKIVIATDISQCTEVAALESTSRSSRKRKSSNTADINASSTDSIYDVKMKICAEKDCSPNQQSLYCHGTHMAQNNLTLKDYNVTATDTIYVMISTDNEDYCWDDNGNIQKEHGFAGTMLFSSSKL